MFDINLPQKRFSYLRLRIMTALLIGVIIFINVRAHAQEEDRVWQVPLNLSRSGATSDPRMVVDSSGDLHVLWREDAVNSFYYTHTIDGQWQKVIPVEVPFGTDRYLREELGERFDERDPIPLFTPELVADGDGRLHAVWTDGENNLYHSSVTAGDFDNYESWSARRFASDSATGFSLAVDNRNALHLIYVDNSDTPEIPAGIYYRRLSSNGESWSNPVALFNSAYYRAAGEDDLNMQIRAGRLPGDESGIYVVLDNRPFEEVLLIRSADRGETWNEPVVIDRRRAEDPGSSTGPTNIDLMSSGEQLHLIWEAGHESNCELYHQWSADDGLTWQPVSVVETDYDGCPGAYWLMVGPNNLLYLLTSASDGSYYLQAWNGEKWSEAEGQPLLSGFEDPATLRRVLLGCHRFTVDPENNMISVGCGSNVDKLDIWLVERALGEIEDWFPVEPVTWIDPISLAASEDRLSEPLIFSGSENLLHTFWLSSGEEGETVDNAKIYYTSWNGEEWSRQVPLIQLQTRHADQLSGIFDREAGLFLLWRDQETNTYYYSAVKSEDILLPAEWSRPAVFPKPDPDALFSAPVPLLDSDGGVNVVYAVPLNEGRGLYLIRANDEAMTWSDPVLIVDATLANWAMVDKPSMTQLENGDLHVIFTVYSLEPEPVARALYYIRSGDGGATWSEPELITEGDIRWSEIVGINPQTVMITWQVEDDGQYVLWSQQSINGGVEWDRPSILLERSAASDSFDLITQLPDHPYLVQVQADLNGGLSLQERIWGDNAWQTIESYELETRLKNEGLLDLAGAITEDGRLMAIFNTETTLQDDVLTGFNVVSGVQSGGQQPEVAQLIDVVPENNLFYTNRSIDLPIQGIWGSPVLETELVADSESNPQPEPVLTPDSSRAETIINEQIDINAADMTADTAESSSNVISIMTALVPAVLVVLIVFAIGIRRALPKR